MLEQLELELGPGPYSVETIAAAMRLTGARVRQLLDGGLVKSFALLDG